MKIDNFKEELKKLGIVITEEQLNKLEIYYELLISWNEKINLTAITNKDDVYLKHFYDSATIVKVINLNEIESLCDIGTGAGFPGIVLKILFPHLKITLIDALEKRIKFLNEVIEKLELKNIITIHERSEDYGRVHREEFDIVTARAVASLPVLMEYCVPLVKKNKYFIAMKGDISQEIKNVNNAISCLNIKMIKLEVFNLPYENSTRSIALYIKEKETSKKYPRKFSEIKKRSL